MAHKRSERGGRPSVSEGLCLERVLMELAVLSGQLLGITWSAINLTAMAKKCRYEEGGRLPLGSSTHEARLWRSVTCRVGVGGTLVPTLIDTDGLVDEHRA